MRTTVELNELTTYRQCPERERYRKATVQAANSPEEQYLALLRTAFVRFYGELMGGSLMSESELRRVWSTMWDIPMGLSSRYFDKSHASMVNATQTDEERMLLRGARVLHQLAKRTAAGQIKPLVVDEPFSIHRDPITIVGTYDLIYQDKFRQYWIVDWTDSYKKYQPYHDLRHAVMIQAFFERTGHRSKVMVDYLRTIDSSMIQSTRSPQELTKQVDEACQIARALVQNIVYRNIGAHCLQCPYRRPCIGAMHHEDIQTARSAGRTRKPSLPRTRT